MKKVSVEKQTQEAGRFLRGGQIDYTIDHNFRVSGARDTILDYADVFSTTLRNDNVEDFDTRWDEIPWSMTKIPSDDVLESLYKMRIRVSDQLKTELQLYDVENSSEDDDTEISTPETRQARQEQWLRVAGYQVATREEKEFAVSGKQKVSVREDTNAVSDMTVMSVQNRHQKPVHLLSHQHQEVQVHRGEGASEAGVRLGSRNRQL